MKFLFLDIYVRRPINSLLKTGMTKRGKTQTGRFFLHIFSKKDLKSILYTMTSNKKYQPWIGMDFKKTLLSTITELEYKTILQKVLYKIKINENHSNNNNKCFSSVR